MTSEEFWPKMEELLRKVVREELGKKKPAAKKNGHDLFAGPPVLSIPLNDGTEYQVTKGMRDELDKLYPAVDPDQTLREIRGWCMTNPAKRKTLRGIPAFINRWFASEQDKQSRRAT